MNQSLQDGYRMELLARIDKLDEVGAVRLMQLCAGSMNVPASEEGFAQIRNDFGFDASLIPYNSGNVTYDGAAPASRDALRFLAMTLPDDEVGIIEENLPHAHPIDGSALGDFFLIVGFLYLCKKGKLEINLPLVDGKLTLELDRERLDKLTTAVQESVKRFVAYVNDILRRGSDDPKDG